ncbi:MAG: T9SS type A sorting domain-containing protein [Saprospiraceae bacterium]|nr:T9SS type A sorting domain-containing protein [Saprospiraceae bacterium]
MKFVTFPQKSFCGAVLSFLFVLVMGAPAWAQVLGTGGNNDPIRSNWENSMGIVFDEDSGEMCVTLSDDNTVYIKISVFLMDPSGQGGPHPNISSLPPMHAEWELSADGVIINAGIMPTPFLATQFFAVSNSLPTLYKAVYSIPVPCSSLCTGSSDTNGGAFCFKRRTRLLTSSDSGTWTPYPFGLYPAAWPTSYFPLVTSSFYTCPNLIEMKRVCCYGVRAANENCEHSGGGGSLGIANYNNSGIGYAQELHPSLGPVSSGNMKAYPNPFNSGFTLSYNQIEPGRVKVECLDMNGRVLKSMETLNTTPGSYKVTIDGTGLAAGVYYLRLSSPQLTELTKIVKAEN